MDIIFCGKLLTVVGLA